MSTLKSSVVSEIGLVGVISLGSGIGEFLARSYFQNGVQVVGTIRPGNGLSSIDKSFVYHPLELSALPLQREAVEPLISDLKQFDILIFTNGQIDPIGPLVEADPHEIEKNFNINLFSTLQLTSMIIKEAVNTNKPRTIIYFSGGGTNSSNDSFGAYTLSKVALIKATELLASENDHIQFVCLGPGWVDTKIHSQVKTNQATPVKVLAELDRRIKSKDFQDPQKIFRAINFIHSKFPFFSGRNISSANDSIYDDRYLRKVAEDTDFLRLRRSGNRFATELAE